MKKKSALIVGATGATGSHLLKQLLAHQNYSRVIVLARRELECAHAKLQQHVIDFDHPESWANLVKADEVFSALGTTLKQAGSKQAQYKVDVEYQRWVAEAAKANAVQRYFLVSSPNANSRSPNFYLKMKGELEDAVRALGFEHCVFFKPSIIESERPDGRLGEKLGGLVLNKLTSTFGIMKKYRPIKDHELAMAITNVAQSKLPDGVLTIELAELFEYLSGKD